MFYNASLTACVNLYAGLFGLVFFVWVFGMFLSFWGGCFFFCRGQIQHLCPLWQRPIEAMVHFADAKFSEMQNALEKITPETPQVWYLKLMETFWP